MNLQVNFDYATAGKVADFLATSGMKTAAARMWQALCWADPYDRAARERTADLLFDTDQMRFAQGSVERSRFLLIVMANCFPTQKLRGAYFENLDELLKRRAKRDRPGVVVLGTGTGRCGSTSLTAAVASSGDVCATHENPPGVWWNALDEQVQFHMRCFRVLTEYFALVFDAAHWWLHVAERFFAEFPTGKIVGLQRDTRSCVQSFVNIKRQGKTSTNHWAAHGNGVWNSSLGDPLYPKTQLPPTLSTDPDASKAAMIEQYVVEYNRRLEGLANSDSRRVLLVRTEQLSDPAAQSRFEALFGRPIVLPSRALNQGNTSDSDGEAFMF
jgi:hypothetical protein